jgi:protein SCO1/2
MKKFLLRSGLAVLFVSQISAARAASCCSSQPPPPSAETADALSQKSLYQLDATWTDDTGKSVALRDLRGGVVVAAMIFTHCEYACPTLVHDLRKIREQLPAAARERMRFVLVTFDTERDTPQRLHTYRAAQGLDAQWMLLRGNAADTRSLAMLLGVRFKREANGQFAHSNLLTVLDAEGEIVHQRAGLSGGLEGVAEAIVRSSR